MKTVLYLPDIGSYSMDRSTAVLSHYKLVKDLVEKKLELKYRVEKISKIKRVEDELFLLIFSTRSLTNL